MKTYVILLALLCSSAVAFAAPQGFDARNYGMGGASVASSRYNSAGISNPALLTRFKEGDTFSVILPSIGAVGSDKEDLLGAIEDFQESVDRVGVALDNLTATPADLADLATQLDNLNGKAMVGNVGGGFSFAMPSKELGWSIFAHTFVDARVTMDIDPGDTALITGATASTDLDAILSEGVVLAASVTEVGVSLAHEFDIAGLQLAVGVTPKAQRIDTFNYSVNVNTFDETDFDASQFSNDTATFNVDVGAAVTLVDNVTIGVMGRNLISRDATTVTTNGNTFTFNLDPTVTVGAAFTSDDGMFTLAADVDVTEFERFKQPNSSSRMLRGGGEFNILDWLQFRAGAKHDLEGTVEDLYTAGFGISPFDVFHIDITGISDLDASYGGVVQLGFTF